MINVSENSTVTINGGEFRNVVKGEVISQFAPYMFTYEKNGKLIINDGSFYGGWRFNGETATTDIYGGDFTVSYDGQSFHANSTHVLTIYGGTFSLENGGKLDPSKHVAEGYKAVQNADGSWTVKWAYEKIADGLYNNGVKYLVENAEGLATLNSMMANNKAGEGITIKLLSDINFAGKTWTPVRSHIDWKSTMNEFNGNGHTISNLTINGQAMFTIFANNHDVVVKDVTFDNAKVTCDGINSAIIVGQTYNNLLLENVDVKNSAITGYYKVAPLIATVYNEGASTITATLKNCDVEDTTVEAVVYDFCTTGMVAFVSAGDNDKIEFENCTVKDVKLYAPNNGYTAHAAIYTTGSATLFNEAEGVTVTNVTFENR